MHRIVSIINNTWYVIEENGGIGRVFFQSAGHGGGGRVLFKHHFFSDALSVQALIYSLREKHIHGARGERAEGSSPYDFY